MINQIKIRRLNGEPRWSYEMVVHRVKHSPIPPPHSVKLFWINYYRRLYSLHCLIESGTYRGATVSAFVRYFSSIYTIELNDNLFKDAHEFFLPYSHINVIHGDSSKILQHILPRVTERCLFWLDGHYSGGETTRGEKETPIIEELAAIKIHSIHNHIILIDDARLFSGQNDYPKLDEVFSELKTINPEYKLRVKDDMIQAYPPKGDIAGIWGT